jgi:uncharacterized protein
MKEIDLNMSLYDLTEAYPELIPILKDLGFAGVANPEMRSTHGKVMTIPKGSQAHGKDLSEVVRTLEEHGFKVKM